MKTFRLIAALVLLAGLGVPLGRVAAQCGGYCQSGGWCPPSGYNCGNGLCCYCCYICESAFCDVNYRACRLADGSVGDLYWFYRQDQYKCYAGSDCHFVQWETRDECPDQNCWAAG